MYITFMNVMQMKPDNVQKIFHINNSPVDKQQASFKFMSFLMTLPQLNFK